MTESRFARRSMLVGSVAAGLVLGMLGWAAGAAASRLRLRLPAPTGRYPVGTTSLHLVDGSRPDPLAPTPRSRELMVRVWYPAADRSGRVARYLRPSESAVLVQQLNALTGGDHPEDLLTFPTHGRERAPVAGRHHPVLVFSPGASTNAALYHGIPEELASRGYVVAGINHTFDCGVVEFPGGRVETHATEDPTDPVLLATRVADTRFVLDRLAAWRTTRAAVFGHSLGSMTAVGALDTDRRFTAGAVLDGNPLGDAALDQPMLMLGNENHHYDEDPDWAAFHDRLRGPRRYLVVDGVLHNDLSDVTVFKSDVDTGTIFAVGPIDGGRCLHIQRRYLTAWFDQTLRGRPNPLLRGESPRFPEVDFQP